MVKDLKNEFIENNNNQVIKTADIIKESSYLFYEMKDIDRKVYYDQTHLNNNNEEYTIKISPLFAEEIIDAPFNEELLSIIFEETPFYYLEPTLNINEKFKNISPTRDIGQINVPSTLQTPFWETWFREGQGFFHNNLLLNIFNKLKYPFIDENQYLNANLFPELAIKAFNVNEEVKESDLNEQPLKFKTSIDENSEDWKYIQNGTEINGIEYLNDIVLQKLKANQSLINYNPDQANLLSSWAESKYQSGMLSADELEREKTIYKLQDIQYELLRRKFAGSSTLYNIALSSINRRGSFIRTVAIGDVTTSTADNKDFRDSRFVRVLNIPGILTSEKDITNKFPFEYLYEEPYKDNKSYIPMDSIIPLFYSSAIQNEKPYNAEEFYLTGETLRTEKKIPLKEYRALRLRDNTDIIEWNTPSSPLSNEDFKEIYHRLDTVVKNIPDKEDLYKKVYRKLDIDYYEGGKDSTGNIIKIPNILDYKTTTLSSNVTTGSVLDVSIDSLLYHENTIQKKDRLSYPYLTYPIADNNSVSLMDTAWMNYLEDSTEQKSKVSDDISFGVQLSHFHQIDNIQKYENIFFALSYGDDTFIKNINNSKGQVEKIVSPIITQGDIPIKSYDEFTKERGYRPKYAYLWLCTLNAAVDSFEVHASLNSTSDINLNLISKITLRIDTLDKKEDASDPYYDIPLKDFEETDIVKNLKNYNIGILPLTYGEIQGNKAASLRYGIYKDKFNEYKIYDDISDLNFSKAYYVFSNSDLITRVGNTSMNPSKDILRGLPDIQDVPSINTKVIYFIVKKSRQNATKTYNNYDYQWSEPLHVINLSSGDVKKENNILIENSLNTNDFLNGDYKIYPDWYGLCYHLNPELNYNEESASSLYRKDIIEAPFKEHFNKETGKNIIENSLSVKKGPSQFTALSNLNRTHNLDFLCNDTGEDTNIYTNQLGPDQIGYLNPIKNIQGFYLDYNHVAKDNPNYESTASFVDVFGDNRFQNKLDGSSSFIINKTIRSNPYISNNIQKYSLHFDYPVNKVNDVSKDYLYNYYELKPIRSSNISEEDWKKWWWNSTFDNVKYPGITLCFNFQVSGLAVYNLFEELNKNNKPKQTKMILAERIDKSFTEEKFSGEFSLYLDVKDASTSKEDQKASFKVYFEAMDENGISYKISSNKLYYIPYTEYEKTYRLSASFGCDEIKTIIDEVDQPEEIKVKVSNEKFIPYDVIPMENRLDILQDPHNPKYASYCEKYPYLLDSSTTLEDINTEFYEINKTVIHKIPTYEISYKPAIRLLIDNEFIEKVENKKLDKEIGINKIDRSNTTSTPIYLHEINLFSRVHKENNWQYNIFYGDIFDFRLYNIGFKKEQLILLNRGLIRELYTYSSSNMKLGYHIYKDLGIFKIKDTLSSRKDLEDLNNNKLPNISSIRLFNRPKWNSILLDPYPVSSIELDPSKAQFRKDAKDPLNDPDIFEIAVNSDYKENILKDAIEQPLANGIEVNNSTSPSGENIYINYNGINHKIESTDLTTIITTSLYPMIYKNHHFISGADLVIDFENNKMYTKADTQNSGFIKLPAVTSKGSLEYQADINLNFEMKTNSDLSVWLSKGVNIKRIYQPDLNKSVAYLENTSKKGSISNYILVPMVIPPQSLIEQDSVGYLDRFIVKDVVLNSALLTLLDATSYYNELRVPVIQSNKTKSAKNMEAIEKGLIPSEIYASKWDGIRVLKEGSYYITCKYPLQIIPFKDSAITEYSSKGSDYTTHYASVRFKILVKGKPVEFDSKYNINIQKDNVTAFYRNNLITTMKSASALQHPSDNRSFPHRQINIDLFVMDNPSIVGNDKLAESNYKWNLIATNHKLDYKNTSYFIQNKEEYNNLQLIDKDHLSSSIVIRQDIPMFLSNNYTAPYFIAGDSKDPSINRKIAKTDASNPILVQVFRTKENLSKENLISNKMEDLDKQSIIAGRSYKLLWDYDAMISEISFSNSEAATTNIYTLNDNNKGNLLNTIKKVYEEEKIDYARSFSILDSKNNLDIYRNIMYNGIANWSDSIDFNSKITSGFETTDGGWQTIGEKSFEEMVDDTPIINKKYCFGNPYSKSSINNYLYSIDEKDRNDINELAYFPYMPTNVIAGGSISSKYYTGIIDTLNDGFIGKGQGATISSDLNFMEESYIEKAYNDTKIKVMNALNILNSDKSGVFSCMSYIRPNIYYKKKGGSIIKDIKTTIDICTSNSDLYAYKAANRQLNITSGITIERSSLYKNNLFINQDFNNRSSWNLSRKGSYKPESFYDINNEGKDIYEITLNKNEPFILDYITGTKELTTKFEIAFVAKSSGDVELPINEKTGKNDYNPGIKIEAIFYKNSQSTKTESHVLPLVKTGIAQEGNSNYIIYSAETPEMYTADSIGFKITDLNPIMDNSKEERTVRIAKVIARVNSLYIHNKGLSDGLENINRNGNNIGSNQKLNILEHDMVVYKNINNSELYPVQFYNNLPERKLGSNKLIATNVDPYPITDFIDNNKLSSFGTDGNKNLIKLIQPWVRHIHYWEDYFDGDNIIHNKTIIQGYEVSLDSNQKLKKSLKIGESNDLYSDAILNYDGHSRIEIKSINTHFSNKGNDRSIFSKYNTNLTLNNNKTEHYLPVILTNEKFTGITNCFNLENIKKKINSEVAVTNIQLLSNKNDNENLYNKDIIYELEYLPIIYDESKHHFSLNFFLQKRI